MRTWLVRTRVEQWLAANGDRRVNMWFRDGNTYVNAVNATLSSALDPM